MEEGLRQRQLAGALSSGNWEEVITPELPSSRMLMRSMIGFGPPRSSPTGKKK
jgi:hypothetical protein